MFATLGLDPRVQLPNPSSCISWPPTWHRLSKRRCELKAFFPAVSPQLGKSMMATGRLSRVPAWKIGLISPPKGFKTWPTAYRDSRAPGRSGQFSARCSSFNPHSQITSCLYMPKARWVGQPCHWSLLPPSHHNAQRKATPYIAREFFGASGCYSHRWDTNCALKSAVLSAQRSLPIDLPSRGANSWGKMPHFANRPLY